MSNLLDAGSDGSVKSRWMVGLLVMALSTVFLASQFDKGWIPHDDGTLAHSAERVLRGELPHRDFDSLYTGGLAYLHALAFRVLGVDLLSLRWTLLLFSLGFVSTVYWIGLRMASPVLSGAVTLLCLVWSVPSYFASMPSWYNLFLAIFGIAFLLRHVEDGRKRWLVLAGLMAGFSCLVKSIGLYSVAGALLFLVYQEQTTSCRKGSSSSSGSGKLDGYSVFVLGSLALFSGTLVLLALRNAGAMEFLHFALPGLGLVGFLVWNGRSRWGTPAARRFRSLFISVGSYGLGVFLPLLVFSLPYILSGSLTALYEGIFELPQRRFSDDMLHPLPSIFTLVTLTPLMIILVAGATLRRCWGPFRYLAILLGLGFLGVLFFASRDGVYRSIWHSVRPVVPLVSLVTCVMLARRGIADSLSEKMRSQIFLLVAMSSMVSLVQFPYPFAIYFCFAAPVVILAVFSVAIHQARGTRPFYLAFLIFYLLFAAGWLNRGFIRHIGAKFTARPEVAEFELDRASLKVPEDDALLYRDLCKLISRHSRPGDYIYAAPDCPELYFLSGRLNPTGTILDVFDRDMASDTEARDRRILATLAEKNVNVVVLCREPEFSRGVSENLGAAIRELYPHRIDFPYFSAFWR